MLRPETAGILLCLMACFACFEPAFSHPKWKFESKKDSLVTVIPFRLIGNAIFLEATVDDRTGFLLLDTGSPGVVIHEKYFKNKRIDASDYYADDLTGSVAELKKTVVLIEVGGMTNRSQQAFLMDLSRIEDSKNMEVLGILGYDFLSRLEIVIDYRQEELTLFSLNSKGERRSEVSMHANPTQVMPMKKTRHLLYLKAEVGETVLKMGIDCGAELSVLKKESIRESKDYFTPSYAIRIVAVSGKEAQANVGIIQPVRIGDLDLEFLEVILTDLDALNRHLITNLDGFLGYGFLSRNKIALNFKKQTLSIWDPTWRLASVKQEK